jgi:hypothetical protein
MSNRLSVRPGFEVPAVGFFCLPETLGLARKYRKRVREQFGSTPSDWPFQDRVLAWIAPEWIPKIEAFHSQGASGMQDELSGAELARLDARYRAELYRRLDIQPRPRRKPDASRRGT